MSCYIFVMLRCLVIIISPCHVMLHICHVEVPCHHHITMPCQATHLSCWGAMSSSYHHAMSCYTFVMLGCHVIIISPCHVIIISPCHVMLRICHVGVPCHHHITTGVIKERPMSTFYNKWNTKYQDKFVLAKWDLSTIFYFLQFCVIAKVTMIHMKI
jgi:hypothetical protein